jgi:hypothetical protein
MMLCKTVKNDSLRRWVLQQIVASGHIVPLDVEVLNWIASEFPKNEDQQTAPLLMSVKTDRFEFVLNDRMEKVYSELLKGYHSGSNPAFRMLWWYILPNIKTDEDRQMMVKILRNFKSRNENNEMSFALYEVLLMRYDNNQYNRNVIMGFLSIEAKNPSVGWNQQAIANIYHENIYGSSGIAVGMVTPDEEPYPSLPRRRGRPYGMYDGGDIHDRP